MTAQCSSTEDELLVTTTPPAGLVTERPHHAGNGSVLTGMGSHALWQNQVMRNLLRRPTIAILAAAPLTAVSLFGAGIGSADPLDCVNGQFWDPITNTCQTPRPAADCAPGEYWNPLSNVCRPLGQL